MLGRERWGWAVGGLEAVGAVGGGYIDGISERAEMSTSPFSARSAGELEMWTLSTASWVYNLSRTFAVAVWSFLLHKVSVPALLCSWLPRIKPTY